MNLQLLSPPIEHEESSTAEPEPVTESATMLQERQLLEGFSPDSLREGRIDWTATIFIVLMHIGCLAAPFFFTWQALAASVLLLWLAGSVGVCLGLHRYLTHQGFELAKPVKFIVCIFSSLAVQGPLLTWVANHRLHHAKSDEPGDPHSPNDGPWWSHMLWLFVYRSPTEIQAHYRRYVPDLMKDPMILFFQKTFILWTILLAGCLYLLGGWPMVVWGICVRLSVGWHITWAVNSATHMWGYRSYQTKDESRNLWWVGLLAWGEGWHNNHHAFPRLARAGHRWWEIDMTWWVIQTLRTLGLATNVVDRVPTPRSVIESQKSTMR